MTNKQTDLKTKAILASIQLPGVSDEDHNASLNELERLVNTLGFEVVGRVSQKRKAPAAGTLFGEGKLTELARYTGGKGTIEGFKSVKTKRLENVPDPDDEDHPYQDDHSTALEQEVTAIAGLVVCDSEITPTQLKNLEEATGAEILDRTGVILEIFSRHARSREAKLQVEIAKLGYMAPRIRASGVGGDRQGGGIGAKGAGETSHELDKRRIRDRISELRTELKSIQTEQGTRRTKREDAPVVALVGYTNAGKSSLMRALTGSEVLVADKLFATLDTTVRALKPETKPRILVSDTVGFIKKLPHDLVASFKSTLDEANNASLLFYTVDASDVTFRSQLEVTKTALMEIGVTKTPYRLILNKIDRVTEAQLRLLKAEFRDGIFISALDPRDIDRVKALIISFFEESMEDEEFFIPYSRGKLIGDIREQVRVLKEWFSDEGTHLAVRGSPEAIARIRKMVIEPR